MTSTRSTRSPSEEGRAVAPPAPRPAPRPATRPAPRRLPVRWILDATVAPGAATLVWSGVIHLRLWTDGYSTIPTIGWMFMVQAITAFVLGAIVVVTRHPVAAAAGALFLAATAMGLVWSVEWGLFGFQDSFSAPFAAESLGVESAGAVVLLLAGAVVWHARHARHARRAPRRRRGWRAPLSSTSSDGDAVTPPP